MNGSCMKLSVAAFGSVQWDKSTVCVQCRYVTNHLIRLHIDIYITLWNVLCNNMIWFWQNNTNVFITSILLACLPAFACTYKCIHVCLCENVCVYVSIGSSWKRNVTSSTVNSVMLFVCVSFFFHGHNLNPFILRTHLHSCKQKLWKIHVPYK